MTSWKKLQLTDKHAELKTLRLSGTTSGGMQPNPSYDPTGSNLHLHDFSGDYNDWQNTGSNVYPNGTGNWKSLDQVVFGGPDTIENIAVEGWVQHKAFYPSYQAPGFSDTSTGTGPTHGITPSTSSTAKNIAQSAGTLFLYAETSEVANEIGEYVYSIASPYLNLLPYTSKKLVFYFHMYGENCGRFRVMYTTNLSSLNAAPSLPMQYSNWPGENGSIPAEGGVEQGSYWSGGTNNPDTSTMIIGTGQIQVTGSSPFNRVEVDLAPMTLPGYIWIVYESGNPANLSSQFKADFAIGNLYLELDGYTVTAQIPNIAPTPTLKVATSGENANVKFLNLPEFDPGVPGALYKDPTTGENASQAQIMISTGPA